MKKFTLLSALLTTSLFLTSCGTQEVQYKKENSSDYLTNKECQDYFLMRHGEANKGAYAIVNWNRCELYFNGGFSPTEKIEAKKVKKELQDYKIFADSIDEIIKDCINLTFEQGRKEQSDVLIKCNGIILKVGTLMAKSDLDKEWIKTPVNNTYPKKRLTEFKYRYSKTGYLTFLENIKYSYNKDHLYREHTIRNRVFWDADHYEYLTPEEVAEYDKKFGRTLSDERYNPFYKRYK